MKTKLNLIAIFIACLSSVTNFAEAQGEGEGGNALSSPCTPAASTWFLGGNTIVPPAGYNPNSNYQPLNLQPQTDVGTCNNFPFILKANNVQSVFIMPSGDVVVPSGKVGIGSGAPAQLLHLNSATDVAVRLEGGMINSRPWDIISSAGTGNIPSGHFGILDVTNNVERIDIDATGKVGIGTSAPMTKLQVKDPTLAEVNIFTDGGNQSRLSLSTQARAYYFSNDNTSGHIGVDDGGGEHPLINFKYNNGEQVWIGTPKPQGAHADFKFAVNGKIVATSVYVTPTGSPNWADYVFADNYKLPKLSDLEKYYQKNKHLPEVPTTKEVSEKGIDLAEMNTLLLKKVEELTLYVVDLNKKIEVLQKQDKSNK